MRGLILALVCWAMVVGTFSNADAPDCKSATIAVLLNRSVDNMRRWQNLHEQLALSKMYRNISPEGTLPGVVIASPSRHEPDYFFHWVRDGALTMGPVQTMNERGKTRPFRRTRSKEMWNFADVAAIMQLQEALGGLGEPKYHVDGKPYNDDWGRPQNDGPALRAEVLTRFANTLLNRGLKKDAEALYDGLHPTESVIKRDLEYVANTWNHPTFDIWEEHKGHHFYTRMVMRKALADGARLALRMKDPGAYEHYKAIAKEVSRSLREDFVENGIILTTVGQEFDYGKKTNLDIAIILGVIHGELDHESAKLLGEESFGVLDDRVLNSASALMKVFQELYPINQKGFPGILIGRYFEDHWDGFTRNKVANPWNLATHGMGELHYRVARELKKKQSIKISEGNFAFFHRVTKSPLIVGETLTARDARFKILVERLIGAGDDFLFRTALHAGEGGSLSEQVHLIDGTQTGPNDLTWSYVSLLSALQERDRAIGVVK